MREQLNEPKWHRAHSRASPSLAGISSVRPLSSHPVPGSPAVRWQLPGIRLLNTYDTILSTCQRHAPHHQFFTSLRTTSENSYCVPLCHPPKKCPNHFLKTKNTKHATMTVSNFLNPFHLQNHRRFPPDTSMPAWPKLRPTAARCADRDSPTEALASSGGGTSLRTW